MNPEYPGHTIWTQLIDHNDHCILQWFHTAGYRGHHENVRGRLLQDNNTARHGSDTIGIKSRMSGSCKTTIQHAMEAASEKMEKEVGKIREDLIKSETILMDETPLSLNGKTAYAWACSGNDSIAYKLATSRSSEIIKMYYSDILDKLITCYGYAGYNNLATGYLKQKVREPDVT